MRLSFTLSQSENLVPGKTKMWKWQSVAATVIGWLLWNSSSAGLMAWVSAWNSGK